MAIRSVSVTVLNKSVATGSTSRQDPQAQDNANTSLSLVEIAIRSLEDDPYLNAGYGSNLTIDGTVECDASIMCAHHNSGPARGCFGSVGAMSVLYKMVSTTIGVKNPISAARVVLEHSEKRDSLGRIPPLTLVSTGAYSFASSRGVPTVPAEALITASAKEKWQEWKEKLEASSYGHNEAEPVGLMDLQDTVGAVAFHETGGIAAGVSSGGLLLKYPGRVGEAAVYGAGCWAVSSSPKQCVACSVSGTGEHITKFALARQIGEALAQGPLEEVSDPHGVLENLLKNFWELGRAEGVLTPSAGVIFLTAEADDENAEPKVRLWCAFTTASMAIAYASTKNVKPKALIVRRPQPTYREKPQIYIASWLL